MKQEIIDLSLKKLFDLTHSESLIYESDSVETLNAFKSSMFEITQVIFELSNTLKLLNRLSHE